MKLYELGVNLGNLNIAQMYEKLKDEDFEDEDGYTGTMSLEMVSDKDKFSTIVERVFGKKYNPAQMKEVIEMLWSYHTKMIGAETILDKRLRTREV